MSDRNTQRIALLIIDHGSKYSAANAMLSDIANMLRSMRPDIIIEIAHMELAEPSIFEGFQACIQKGATHIIAHPYMLAPGRHATRDIPNIVAEAAARFTSITYEVTDPLGVDPKLGELILQRAGL